MTPSPHRPYGAGDNPTPYPQQPPPAPAPRRTGRIVAIVVAAVLALCVGVPVVIAIAAGADTERPHTLTDQDAANRAAAAAPSTSPTAATTAPSSPAATTTAPKPTKPVKTTPPPVIIGDGIYRVGEDIPAGRYKVVERADSYCYWSRTRNGDIIDNGLGGGFPSFTTRKGEDVEISTCPEFKRVGK